MKEPSREREEEIEGRRKSEGNYLVDDGGERECKEGKNLAERERDGEPSKSRREKSSEGKNLVESKKKE